MPLNTSLNTWIGALHMKSHHNIDLSTTDHLGIKHKRVICQILEQTGKQILSTHINHYNETLSLTLFQFDELLDTISHSTSPEVKEFILEFTDS